MRHRVHRDHHPATGKGELVDEIELTLAHDRRVDHQKRVRILRDDIEIGLQPAQLIGGAQLVNDPVAAASVPVRREGQVGYDGQMRRSRAFKLGDQTHDLVFQPRFVLRIEEGDDARLVHGVATHQTEEDLSAALDRDGLKA